ncbi:MAG: nitrogen fixation protein NifM [Pseudomonadota bacterium]|jgi:nitrogen fixation protein NifM
MPETACSPYFTIKFSHALYDKTPDSLDDEQRQQVTAAALRAHALESRILASREASGVIIGQDAVQRGLAEITARFATEADFVCELARHGLSHQALNDEIERSLRVDAVLERVSSNIQPVTQTDIEIFYLMHQERFKLPERRTMRHILITLNEDLPGNSRQEAHAKLVSIREQCQKQPARFAELALRHSECPTAMQGGLLGKIERGTLYPALDEASFQMRPGDISIILESPMGLHILRCDNLEPGGPIPLNRVRDRIREQLTEIRRQNKQRTWIRKLPGARSSETKAAA